MLRCAVEHPSPGTVTGVEDETCPHHISNTRRRSDHALILREMLLQNAICQPSVNVARRRHWGVCRYTLGSSVVRSSCRLKHSHLVLTMCAGSCLVGVKFGYARRVRWSFMMFVSHLCVVLGTHLCIRFHVSVPCLQHG